MIVLQTASSHMIRVAVSRVNLGMRWQALSFCTRATACDEWRSAGDAALIVQQPDGRLLKLVNGTQGYLGWYQGPRFPNVSSMPTWRLEPRTSRLPVDLLLAPSGPASGQAPCRRIRASARVSGAASST